MHVWFKHKQSASAHLHGSGASVSFHVVPLWLLVTLFLAFTQCWQCSSHSCTPNCRVGSKPTDQNTNACGRENTWKKRNLEAVRGEGSVALRGVIPSRLPSTTCLSPMSPASFLESVQNLILPKIGGDRLGEWLRRQQRLLRCLPRACFKLSHRRVLILFTERILGVQRRSCGSQC